MTDTINLTPRGAETPEGVDRINRAMRAVDDANAECARVLDELATEHRNRERLDWEPVADALKHRAIATEEFLRAMAGVPAQGGAQ